MATHNEVRVVGYMLTDPRFVNPGPEGKCIFRLRTIRRDIQGFTGENYADIIIYYSGMELMKKFVEFKQFDVLDIKGVFNILPTNKKSVCPCCGTVNEKKGIATMIYPLSVSRIGSYEEAFDKSDESSGRPTELLMRHYKEVSNQVLIIGTVTEDPIFVTGDHGGFCRYKLGVDRKYFIREQTEQHADYPWIYSYGNQAIKDNEHLKKGTVVMVDGFIHNENFMVKRKCESCESNYYHNDTGTQITPYSVEYLNNYITNEDIAKEKSKKEREEALRKYMEMSGA